MEPKRSPRTKNGARRLQRNGHSRKSYTKFNLRDSPSPLRSQVLKNRSSIYKKSSRRLPRITSLNKSAVKKAIIPYFRLPRDFKFFDLIKANDPNHPVPGRRPNASNSFKNYNSDKRESRVRNNQKTAPFPGKYCSQKLKKTSSFKRTKVYNIVQDAIEYGLKSGIIKRSGKYFYFHGKPTGKYSKFLPCNAANCKICKPIEENITPKAENRNRPKVNPRKKQIIPSTIPRCKKVQRAKDSDRILKNYAHRRPRH